MNLTRYLKIVKINGSERLMRFMEGLAFYRSLPNKKMRGKLDNPRILLLEDATGLTSSDGRLVSMETILQQEENYTQIFVKKVMLLDPTLILVEHGMSEKSLAELASHEITALLHVKKSVMELVSRLSHGKIRSTIDQAASYRKTVLGNCKEFSTRAVGQRILVLLTPTDEVCRVGTVLVSAENSEQSSLKTAIRTLAVDYRNSLLEADLLLSLNCEATSSILIDNYSVSTSLFYLTVCGKPCLLPQPVSVQFYLDGDSPLGLKLVRFCKQASEACVCGVASSEHTHVFLGRGGLVRISKRLLTDEKIEVEEKDHIYVKTECRLCGQTVSQTTLPAAAWEYSFYKFLTNFFKPLRRLHKFHMCECDFFRDFFFVFTLQNVQLKVGYESRPLFILQPLSARRIERSPVIEELYGALKFKALLDLKSAGQEVVASQQQAISQLLVEIDSQSQKDSLRLTQESRNTMKKELVAIVESMISALADITALSDSDISSYLSVEFYRRQLFFAVCRAKTLYENSCDVLSGKAPRRKSPEISLLCNPGHSPSASLDGSEFFCDSSVMSMSISNSRFLHPRSESRQLDPLLRSRNFEYLQRGALTLPLGADQVCVPVEEDNTLSIIAYTLSSQSYRSEVGRCSSDSIQTELLSPEPNHHNSFFSSYEDSDLATAENRSELQKFYGPSISFHVTAYYPRQFQALQACSATMEQFVLSLARSMPARNGQCLSHDGKFRAKFVDEKEFAMFLDLAPNYFRYVFKTIFRSMPSLLARTLGAFRVSVRKAGQKRIDWILLTEHIGFEVPRPCATYFLSGGLEAKKGTDKTDADFLEAMNQVPLCVTPQSKKLISAGMWNDSRFLSKQNFVDYSLQLLVRENEIWVGICDYGQQFTFDKVVENRTRQDIDSISPEEYKLRFRTHVSEEYFAAVE